MSAVSGKGRDSDDEREALLSAAAARLTYRTAAVQRYNTNTLSFGAECIFCICIREPPGWGVTL